MTRVGFPHSDILGSTLGWQLPEAYRSLPRPSSALDAKASTMRPLTLTNTKTKVFIKNCTNKHTTPTRGQRIHSMLATTIQLPNTTPHHQDGATPPRNDPSVVSGPNSVPGDSAVLKTRRFVVVHPAATHYGRTAPHGSHPHQLRVSFVVLLRKEVIQPHLPVRLPCYDFVPIADPTFDSSPHKG